MQVYGAPRQLDLISLLVLTSLLAGLFSLLRAAGGPFWLAMALCGLLVWVGAAQAVLFHGHHPRSASIVAGIAVVLPLAVWIRSQIADPVLTRPSSSVADWAFFLFAWLITVIGQGFFLGYVTGALVGGAFLLADYVRTALKD